MSNDITFDLNGICAFFYIAEEVVIVNTESVFKNVIFFDILKDAYRCFRCYVTRSNPSYFKLCQSIIATYSLIILGNLGDWL